MKIKIVLAGKNESRHQFILSLVESLKLLKIKLDKCNASVNVIGTGSYHFKFNNDDIELLYIEDAAELRPNYKKYTKDANALILVDADKETSDLLVKACPQKIAQAQHNGGGKIDGMKGVKLVVAQLHAREEKPQAEVNVTAHAGTQFYRPKTQDKHAVQGQGVNMELLKEYLKQGNAIREYKTRKL